MSVAIITGSAGLVGSEAAEFFAAHGFEVKGIDNNLRKTFFGDDASTEWRKAQLEKKLRNYEHFSVDVRDNDAISQIFGKNGKDISLIIHAAAQPSHDWAASNPFFDFTVNANGTLVMLENFRRFCPEAVFIFVSTNKVYGDLPNQLPLEELGTRFEVPKDHRWHHGIDETMSIDDSTHSLFGVSKAAADLMVQEYGRYFGLKTGAFRGGCLTGPSHSGTRLHGFLSYLVRCCLSGKKYFIYGYEGKQVRDNIHSHDLVNAFWHFYKNPRAGEVYNIGGSRHSNASMLEAIELCQEITGKKVDFEYVEENRIGDHKWWISDVSKFKSHYPDWKFEYDIEQIMTEIVDVQENVVVS